MTAILAQLLSRPASRCLPLSLTRRRLLPLRAASSCTNRISIASNQFEFDHNNGGNQQHRLRSINQRRCSSSTIRQNRHLHINQLHLSTSHLVCIQRDHYRRGGNLHTQTATHEQCTYNIHHQLRGFSSLPDNNDSDSDSDTETSPTSSPSAAAKNNIYSKNSHPCQPRLLSLRNVGIFAHVDAGKTTVTERMLALSGLVHTAGSVDTGDTVTDYLPAERERGITIQSAAVGFDWVVPPSTTTATDGESNDNGKRVSINLIDTPGHVDFSVEVHRSVAVLDGAVLVVDAVAGVQAQTETVWRAIRNTDTTTAGSTMSSTSKSNNAHGSHAHEPLPALMYINKMDREGADFRHAIDTVRRKLRESNPVPIQLPLYRMEDGSGSGNTSNAKDNVLSDAKLGSNIVAGSLNDSAPHGEIIGCIDLVNMRAIIYPDNSEHVSMEEAVPTVVPIQRTNANEELLEMVLDARRDLISNLADVDEIMEDLYLNSMELDIGGDACPIIESISTQDIQSSVRRMTLDRKIMPTLCGAALRGVGVEPVLDCVAEYLPSPLDRLPPQLSLLGNTPQQQQQSSENSPVTLGHPFHPSTLAFVFKVLHMKGRGGSGDGRVAFARVYSGTIKARDSVRVISPSANISSSYNQGKNKKQKHPIERIGGMLELSGGQFNNLSEGSCPSGDVCALVGLKGVVTGDTLLLTSAGASGSDTKKSGKGNKKKNDTGWKQYMDGVHLAGLTSPKPVLTIRLEANSASDQARLSEALGLLSVEDPSLVVEETPTTTLISGLGELHMEIILDRLRREFGLEVRTGKPAVAYRETVSLEKGEVVGTDGMVEYDRTVGGIRLQGSVGLQLRQNAIASTAEDDCFPPEDPTVTLSPAVRTYFNLDPKASDEDLEHKFPPALQALLLGVRGSLKRGRVGPYPLANLECQITEVDSEVSGTDALPGCLRAAAANAVNNLLEYLAEEDRLITLEPKMNVEVSVPTGKVGDVLSDLTTRRSAVDDVAMAEEGGGTSDHVKSMVRAEVPLIEILGYANSLRSLTGGEGAFSAEYKGHAPQDGM